MQPDLSGSNISGYPERKAIGSMKSVLVVGLTAVLALAVVNGLEAHTALRASSPGDGETVHTLPPSVRLEFTAAIDGNASEVRLVDSTGTAQPLELRFDPGTPTVLEALLPGDLASGAYQISWRTLASDGHPVRGEFAFTADLPAPPPEPAAPPTPTEASEPALTPTGSDTANPAFGTGTVVLAAIALGALVAAVLALRRRSARSAVR